MSRIVHAICICVCSHYRDGAPAAAAIAIANCNALIKVQPKMFRDHLKCVPQCVCVCMRVWMWMCVLHCYIGAAIIAIPANAKSIQVPAEQIHGSENFAQDIRSAYSFSIFLCTTFCAMCALCTRKSKTNCKIVQVFNASKYTPEILRALLCSTVRSLVCNEHFSSFEEFEIRFEISKDREREKEREMRNGTKRIVRTSSNEVCNHKDDDSRTSGQFYDSQLVQIIISRRGRRRRRTWHQNNDDHNVVYVFVHGLRRRRCNCIVCQTFLWLPPALVIANVLLMCVCARVWVRERERVWFLFLVAFTDDVVGKTTIQRLTMIQNLEVQLWKQLKASLWWAF